MKHNLFTLIIMVALIFTVVGVAVSSTAYAATSCSTQPGNYYVAMTIPLTVSAGDTITVTSSQGPITLVYPGGTAGPGYPTESGTATAAGTATVHFGAPLGVAFYTITVCSAGGGPTQPLVTWKHFTDGRINDVDAWETSAIYFLGNASGRWYYTRPTLWLIP